MNDYMTEEAENIIHELNVDNADTIVHGYASNNGAYHTVTQSLNNSFHMAAVVNTTTSEVIIAKASMTSGDDALIALANHIKDNNLNYK